MVQTYLAEGTTDWGFTTFVLIQNPNDAAVTVEITYLTLGGTGNKTFTDKVPANSRKSYTLSDVFPVGRASILIKSKNKGLPIMVERSMYWNNRGAGTDSV
jgi:hypothetical protein